MTVKELKEILDNYPDDEKVYIWKGNWPVEHYSTNIEVSNHIYGSANCDGETVNNPLIII